MLSKWNKVHIATLGAGLAWLALGLIDFQTSFVDYSAFRLLALILLLILLLPLRVPLVVQRPFARLAGWRWLTPLAILALATLGFALFYSRYARGANMGDTLLFKDIIEHTTPACVLCDHTGNWTQLKAHTNWFLLLFIPIRGLTEWLLAAAWLQSLCIVVWCRIAGRALGGNALTGWVVTGALFLATYTQHSTFYDTRFAALSLIVFAAGTALNQRRTIFGGMLGVFLTRETAALNVFMLSVAQIARRKNVRLFIFTTAAGLLWYFGMVAIERSLGGPQADRFDPCIFTARLYSDPICVGGSLAFDWPLKVAYTLRVLLFAPTLVALPAYFAVLPDVGYTWLSKGDVLYNLSWHYYMQALGIVLIGASTMLKQTGDLRYADKLLVRWVVAMSLWQFVTTFQVNLL